MGIRPGPLGRLGLRYRDVLAETLPGPQGIIHLVVEVGPVPLDRKPHQGVEEAVEEQARTTPSQAYRWGTPVAEAAAHGTAPVGLPPTEEAKEVWDQPIPALRMGLMGQVGAVVGLTTVLTPRARVGMA